jgi:hypothetical protein
MRKKILHLVLLFVGFSCLGLFLFGGQKAQAANPNLINFQGKVVNADGTNVTNGTYSFNFVLFDDPTAGTESDGVHDKWHELSKSVAVTNGVFQTELGSATTLPDFSQFSALYLGVKFNSDSAGYMTPRIHLDSAPYAKYSDNSAALGGLAATNFVQLAQGLQTDSSTTNASIAINKTNASGTPDILLLQKSGQNVLEVNNSGTVLLGQAGASGLNGTLTFNNSAGSSTVSLSLQANPGSSYTLLLPTTGPSTSQCLQTDGTTANQLTFAACATGGSGATSVAYSATANSSGGSITGSVLTLAKADGSNPGLLSADAQTIGGDKTLQGNTILTGTTNVEKTSTAAFAVQTNSGTSTLLNADTSNMRIGVDVTYSSMTVPSGLTSTASAGTGFTAGQSYLYEVTAIDSAGGETTVSNEPTACAPATTNLRCTLAWTAVTGASGYKIYRSASGGVSGSEKYLTTVLVNSYIDANTITLSSTAIPGSNTAYTSSNSTGSSLLQLSVGGLGKPTGQIYVSGILPTLVGRTSFSATPFTVAVQGRYAYVGSSGKNLTVFDISNPESPVDVSNGGVGSTNGRSIFIAGHYAYVTDGSNSKLLIYDISKPSAPVETTGGGVTVVTAVNASSIYVQGRYAYIAGGSTGKLNIFDISNPAKPVDVTGGGVSLGSELDSIYVQGKYAYVTDGGNSKLMVVDVSNPASPQDVSGGGVSIGAGTQDGLVVRDRYAYVTSGNSTFKLQIFDVSNPASLIDVSGGGANIASTFWSNLRVQGDYAYLPLTAGSIQVFDISNPTAPVDISGGGISAGGGCGSGQRGMFIQGRYLYGITTGCGHELYVMDLGGIYAQQLEAGGAEFGTLSVDSNSSFAGDANIQGGVQVGQSIQAAGNLGISGGAFVQGSSILGGGSNTLGPPSGAVTVTPTLGASATWSYVITTVNSSGGESTASATGTTAAGAATLDATHFNTISWSSVTGASAYKVYRTAHGTTPSTNGYIGTTTSTSLVDNGLAGAGNSAPTIDTTGQLTVEGSALFNNTTNSTTALQVQNTIGSNAFSVDTTPLNTLLVNSNFENTNTGNWVYSGAAGGSASRSTAQSYLGTASLAITSGTVTTASDGVKYVVGTSLTASTTYTLSFYAMTTTTTALFNNLTVTYSPDGGTTNFTCMSGQTVTFAWGLRFSCSFNSTQTGVNPNTSAYFIIQNGDTTTRTFYIDAVQLEQASSVTAYKESGINLQGTVTSNTIFSGLLTLQPSAGLATSQSGVQQTLTSSAANGGFVTGYNQTITVNNSTFASTTQGINIAITDATTLANATNGVKATLTDNGASGAKTNKAVTGTAGGTNASAINYGGYFTISGGAAGSTALYASNGTLSANILDLQDGNAGSGGTNISVFTVANNGVTTAKSNSATGFQIQDSSNSKSLFTVDTSGDQVVMGMQGASGVNGKIQFNTTNASNTFVALAAASTASSFTLTLPTSLPGASNYCIVSTNLGALSFSSCGASSTATVTLSPEFPGAVLTADGTSNTGTMTSDFCSGSGSGGININAAICDGATATAHNYYAWTASATDDYDVWTQWQVPTDWASFSSITFSARVSTTTSDSVVLTIYKVGQTAACGSGTVNTGTTWQTSSSISTASCTLSPGNKIYFDAKLTVGVTNDFARMGEINIVYNRN